MQEESKAFLHKENYLPEEYDYFMKEYNLYYSQLREAVLLNKDAASWLKDGHIAGFDSPFHFFFSLLFVLSSFSIIESPLSRAIPSMPLIMISSSSYIIPFDSSPPFSSSFLSLSYCPFPQTPRLNAFIPQPRSYLPSRPAGG